MIKSKRDFKLLIPLSNVNIIDGSQPINISVMKQEITISKYELDREGIFVNKSEIVKQPCGQWFYSILQDALYTDRKNQDESYNVNQDGNTISIIVSSCQNK